MLTVVLHCDWLNVKKTPKWSPIYTGKCFKISGQKLDIPMIVEGEEERSIFGHVQEGTTPSLNIVI